MTRTATDTARGIAIAGLCHRIGTAQILHDIDLAIPAGKVTALIGPNGAGKSTLLRLVGRLVPCDRGRIEIDGRDVTHTDTTELARHVAILGQDTPLASRLTVAELVAFGRWPHHRGRPRIDDDLVVTAAIERFGLAPMAHRFLDELSGGQRQRAFLAMTFAQSTPWILLDEPLNNLDMSHARSLMRELGRLRDEGKSIVVVVHEVNYAAAWADHVIAMKDGRVAAEGPPAEVLTPAILGPLYDMELEVAVINGRPMVLHHL
ncbi:iron ABC transporter ATP-binding protein [Frigidibacter sp. MR17.24]|uniref:iron ABC transporter ATP-binding protein n=1 Tax=Frigidibacter sp. MR17.24 TaxID=3127345 RepID=UPI003012FD39